MAESQAGKQFIIEADSEGRKAWPIIGIIGGVVVVALSLASAAWPGVLIGGVLSGGSGLLGRDNLAAAYRWTAPDLVLPSQALEMESPVQVQYRRRSRKVADVSTAELRLTLVCEEHVSWTERGTDAEGKSTTETHHDTQEVYREGIVGSVQGTAKGLEGVAALMVPVTAGAPSFTEANNDVSWHINAELHGLGMPKDRHRFDVVVLPQLGAEFAVRQSRRVQDS